ncbi:MAG: Rieske 2Fe-2S domain-containing protein [Phycisphaerales bacterium]
MAETHLEVVKVWIEPGCIVCDACETDCPEVFDVQEDTCLIRPEAMKPDFTKPLTPSIEVAAEGCPVDVIKFDTVEVEGPEPEEWKAIREGGSAADDHGAAAGAGDGKAAAAVGAAPTLTPPDPKWIELLEAAHVSGGRSAGGPRAYTRQAKAPAEAIASSVTTEDAPDAQFATMVGAGYARPRKSVAQSIRERAEAMSSGKVTRRGFTAITMALFAGWAAFLFVGGTFAAWFQSFMVPKAPIQPPTKIRVGKVSNYTELGVYEDYKPQEIWLITLEDEGVRKVVALNTVCTHLGCIPNWLPGAQIFKCPCHGSGFRKTGVNFEGPAPRPLERFALKVDPSGVVIVDKSKVYRYELGQWSDPDAFVALA